MTNTANRLPDPRADQARDTLYTPVPEAHTPVAIEQHSQPHLHVNRALLISAEYALLRSPATYHPVNPDDPRTDAVSATMKCSNQPGHDPMAVIHLETGNWLALPLPFILDGYGHEDMEVRFPPGGTSPDDVEAATELAYLAIVEQIDENQYQEADEVRSLQYRASLAASTLVQEAVEAARQQPDQAPATGP